MAGRSDMVVDARVRPGRGSFSFEWVDGRLFITTSSKAESGRANQELVRELSRSLGCTVRILSGASSRRKRLLLEKPWIGR